ncbi:MAG TPA: hypothetical protein VE135_04805 [Pyrinomonadaceae bacterium]|nr:hypothetical protein [Pyrinomonadaceae bacterium]
MQTFVQKQKRAGQSPASNLQIKKSQPVTSQSQEVERTLNDSAQANMVANYQNLFDKSPGVESVNSHQMMANNSPGVVAQAKFQNVLNNRIDAPQVAQLKPDVATSGPVVQRNGDGEGGGGGSDWGKKLFLGGLGGYFAGTRALAKHTAEPLGFFGAEHGAGLFGMGDYVKGVNMLRYGQQIFKGGYARHLAVAPLALATAYMMSKYMGSLKKDENLGRWKQ